MKIRDVLKSAGAKFVTVAPDDRVITAARLMKDAKKGLAAVVDADGTCMTQRNHAELATVETALEGDDVVLSSAGHGDTRLRLHDWVTVMGSDSSLEEVAVRFEGEALSRPFLGT